MRFSPSFLDEIRDRVPISDVIGKRVSWDRRKTNQARGDWWACCPFHGEKTPSFHCEDAKGRYHCFGCKVSGDHFRFLTDLEGLTFVEAVQQIADMAGVAMPAPDPQAERRERQRASLQDVMEMATAFFEGQLQSADGARARSYLRERGLSGRTIQTFRLGFAPNSRNALKEYLAGKGVEKDQIEACGLVVHGPDIPVSYDRFRDRVMFPIHSARDKIIAFGGRALSPDAPAKYLNSNDTELFHKGEVLYNFSRARRAAQDPGGEPVLIAVEGYMDVIALQQTGIGNAVAPLGTALTQGQLELLWRASPTPVLCFDGDDAGRRAAARAADLALAGIKPGRSVRFAILPQGKDPDDLVRRDGRAPFDAVIAEARPLADMIWLRESGAGSFDTPEKRAALEARLKQVTATIADDSVRYHYAQDMRERLQALFRPAGFSGAAGRPEQGRSFSGQGRRGDRGGRSERAAPSSGRFTASERLTRSSLVSGVASLPPLRESLLALTVINHPKLLIDEFDEIAAIDFENPGLRRLWTAVLGASPDGNALERGEMLVHLKGAGFEGLIQAIDRQIRNARIWIALPDAALEDVREAFHQALALHKRTRDLKWQKQELEREIAETTEDADGEEIARLMMALAQVQMEIARLEHQQAIIDGFGIMSGRVVGPARA